MSRSSLRATSAFPLILLVLVTGLPAVAGDAAGFLYGTVVADDGTAHQGRLRWDDEEASWNDLFNATKRDRPLADEIPLEERRQGRPIKIFGLTIGRDYGHHGSGRSLNIFTTHERTV